MINSAIWSDRGQLLQWIELLYLLVLKELKTRYKRSFLGYLWAILNPLAFALVYWLAFKFIMRIQMANYGVFVITGMFPWAWINQAVFLGTGSYTNNPSLVRRVTLPRITLPLSCVLQEMVHFVFAIPVVYFFIAFSGESLSLVNAWWQIPLMLIIQSAIVFPLTLIGAVLNVYARDVQYLVGISFALLFYATPMVYPVTMVPDQYQSLFRANPFFALIESWRSVFLSGILPWEHCIYVVLWGAGLGLAASWLFRAKGIRIAELV